MNKEQFNLIFREKGGVFEYENMQGGELLSLAISDFERQKIGHKPSPIAKPFPPIYTDFIANDEFNAVAAKLKNDYFIGINIGTVLLLKDLFFRMLSTKTIFPEIGDSSREITTQKLFNPQLTNFRLLALQSDINVSVMPIDDRRQIYAISLFKTALNFLFNHEYAHIIFGHVDYLSSLMGTQDNSFLEEKRSEIDPKVSQTLEYMADSYAVYKGMSFLEFAVQNPNGLAEAYHNIYSNWQAGISNFLFAVYSLFRLFGYSDYKSFNPLIHSHPPTGLRQVFMAENLFALNEVKNTGITNDGIYILFHETVEKVEAAFQELSESQLDRTAINYAFTTQCQQQHNEILRNSNNVVDLLQPHTFEVLAKADIDPSTEDHLYENLTTKGVFEKIKQLKRTEDETK